MVLLIVLIILILYGTGAVLNVGGNLIHLLLVLALAGLVYQIWTGRNPA
jgi:hypothetical protein